MKIFGGFKFFLKSLWKVKQKHFRFFKSGYLEKLTLKSCTSNRGTLNMCTLNRSIWKRGTLNRNSLKRGTSDWVTLNRATLSDRCTTLISKSKFFN